jgi:hypothetical protein
MSSTGKHDSDTVEPDDAVHPASLDCRRALQLQTQFDKDADTAARSSTRY